MAYEVLARKYRPQRFGDLVGQEHIARTLSQAILRDRVAHAFLFTGVRGVGKTSAARILAKTLNCLNRSKTETDPCGQCDACLEIAQGVDIDVFEIDGASNNSVDDIRKLQEILPYRPTRDPYRVVIIDEVHMLSSGAFNALLKTLEEPPSHVKFIFATTEAQKVPLTVRSRCQRFDFRLISEAQIVERLSQILSSENVTFEVEALRVLAREAAGSMRDALTLLDQIIAYDPEGIRYDKVLEVLGIAHEPTVLAAVYAVLNGEADKVFDVVAQVADHGLDMLHFAKQLQTLLRDLVYHRVTGEQELSFELSREALSEAQERLANVDNAELIRAFYAAGELVDDIARSQLPRMMLEMGLVSMAARPSLKDIGEVLSELREQEQRLGTAPASVVKPSVALAPAPARPAQAPTNDKVSMKVKPATPQDAEQKWEQLVTELRAQNPALSAVLEFGIARWDDPNALNIVFPENSFYARQAQQPEALAAITGIASRLSQCPVHVRFLSEQSSEQEATLAQKKIVAHEALRDKHTQAALNHPAVRDVLDVFPESASSVEVSVNIETDGNREGAGPLR